MTIRIKVSTEILLKGRASEQTHTLEGSCGCKSSGVVLVGVAMVEIGPASDHEMRRFPAHFS